MQEQTITALRESLAAAGLPFVQDEPLAGHTTFKIGGPAAFWCTPHNAEELRSTLALCRENGARVYLLGNGSNTLFDDAGFDGAVMDVRGVRSIEQLKAALDDLDAKKIDYDILFLDANDSVIQRRYKETRRQHPITISEKVPITEAIAKERKLLQPLREKAKYVIDTSLLSAAQNRERVCSLFLDKGESPMELMVVSFGFKYGLPQEADLVLDVRCLPNPFYVPELKHKTGLDQEVVDLSLIHI